MNINIYMYSNTWIFTFGYICTYRSRKPIVKCPMNHGIVFHSLSLSVCTNIRTYKHIYVCIHTYIYTYTYHIHTVAGCPAKKNVKCPVYHGIFSLSLFLFVYICLYIYAHT